MNIKRYEELNIWKSSIALVKRIYALTSTGKWNADYGLRDQIRRAVISISSNIVEGFEKNNNNEFSRFLKIAKGSIGEVRSQLLIAYELKYIEEKEYSVLKEHLILLSKQVSTLISYLINYKRKINNN